MLRSSKKFKKMLPVVVAASMLGSYTIYAAEAYAIEPMIYTINPSYPDEPEETSGVDPNEFMNPGGFWNPNEPPTETTTTEPPYTPPVISEETTPSTETEPPYTIPDDTTPSTETEPSDTTPEDTEASVSEETTTPMQITLNFREYTLHTGEGVQLTANVVGGNINTAITFTSSNTNVVRVDASGYIIATGEGTANVYASAGNVSEYAVIRVIKPVVLPEYLIPDNDNFSLKVGESAQINVTLLPAEAAVGYTLEYSSDNEAVASVNADGNITAVGEGTAVITVSGAGLTTNVNVTVSADDSFATADLSGYLYGGDGSPLAGMHLKLGDMEAVTDTNGFFLFQNAEQRTLNLCLAGNENAACSITLSGNTVVYLLFDKDTNTLTRAESYEALAGQLAISSVDFISPNVILTAGEVYELAYQYEPSDASVTNIKYESSNEMIAQVGQVDGVITARSAGEAKITLSLNGGQASTVCTITVNPKQSSLFSPLILITEGIVMAAAAAAVIIFYRKYKIKRELSMEDEDSDGDIHDID